MEAEIVLTAFAQRAERIEISGQPRRRPNNTLHAWSSLPVTIHSTPT
jgi:4-methoxybenzoate monooxygenase (O-demethylating)